MSGYLHQYNIGVCWTEAGEIVQTSVSTSAIHQKENELRACKQRLAILLTLTNNNMRSTIEHAQLQTCV